MADKPEFAYPLSQILSWGIPILIAVAAGTFTLTKFGAQQNVEALRTQPTHAEKQRKAAERRVTELETKRQQSGRSPFEAASLPEPTTTSAVSKEDAAELGTKIEKLEAERLQLIQLLSKAATESLDPKSELPVLLRQLGSDDKSQRDRALSALFTLRDPASFSSLVDFLKNQREEATRGYNPTISEWYDLFLELDDRAAMDLIAKGLAAGDELESDVAFRVLQRHATTPEVIDAMRPYLENVALRSNDTRGRTKAKALLQVLSARKADILAERERATTSAGKGDRRSTREILLGVETMLTNIFNTKPGEIEQGAEGGAVNHTP